MDWINIITSTLAFVGVLYISFSKQYAKKFADLLFQRDLAYEAEKGKNIATKEDIQEITQKIEEVKSEISFRKQWEHDLINKREQRLINILTISHKISMTYNHILLMAGNSQQASKLLDLVEELNNDALQLTTEGNLMVVHYSEHKQIHEATTLVDTAVKYAAELACLANNAAVNILASEEFKKRALESIGESSKDAMENAMSLANSAKQLPTKPLQFKKPTEEAINAYIFWLEKLYGDGSILKPIIDNPVKTKQEFDEV